MNTAVKFGALALTSILLAGCGSGKDKGVAAFEEYFGDYDVVSAPEKNRDYSCPITSAKIREDKMDGYSGVVIEATGAVDGQECVTMKMGLTVSGMKDVSCETRPGYSRCTRGQASLEAKATRNGRDVRLELTGDSPGSYSIHTWILRRH